MKSQSKVIGILALQGDYEAHRRTLERLGEKSVFVRTAEELEQADALILPGGESTTMAKLLDRIGLDAVIKQRAAAGMPLYGTCAGMILLAKDIQDRPDQPTLDLMDIEVARNAFGRQLDSFEAEISFHLDEAPEPASVHGIFIRAPYVTQPRQGVQVLSRYENRIVGVRQGNMLATAFHPELTEDPRIHAYFARMVAASKESR